MNLDKLAQLVHCDFDPILSGKPINKDEEDAAVVEGKDGQKGGVATGGKWNTNELESLKRLVLQYGCPGRWDKIREASR